MKTHSVHSVVSETHLWMAPHIFMLLWHFTLHVSQRVCEEGDNVCVFIVVVKCWVQILHCIHQSIHKEYTHNYSATTCFMHNLKITDMKVKTHYFSNLTPNNILQSLEKYNVYVGYIFMVNIKKALETCFQPQWVMNSRCYAQVEPYFVYFMLEKRCSHCVCSLLTGLKPLKIQLDQTETLCRMNRLQYCANKAKQIKNRSQVICSVIARHSGTASIVLPLGSTLPRAVSLKGH